MRLMRSCESRGKVRTGRSNLTRSRRVAEELQGAAREFAFWKTKTREFAFQKIK